MKNRMNTWFSLSLGDGITAGMPSAEIGAAFWRDFNNVGKPSTMAIFTRPESEGRLHCEVIAYFSPDAQETAIAFEAEPCEKPVRAGLSLLAGNDDSWSILFPGRDV